jgi:hypothetical protein
MELADEMEHDPVRRQFDPIVQLGGSTIVSKVLSS